tara:strand:+ start:334 stop:1242 length:909 start_codon:yes stop_codon:yes gene_type:complete
MIYECIREDIESVEVKQVKKGRGHAYRVTIDGKDTDYPSVTTVLRATDGSAVDAISRWTLKVAMQEVEDSIYVGTQQTTKNMKNVIVSNAKNKPSAELALSATKGTLLHKAFELYMNDSDDWTDGLLSRSNDMQYALFTEDQISPIHDAFKSIAEWIEKEGFEVVATEIPVYNSVLQVCGTIDFVLSDNHNRIYVCDLKTGKNVYSKDALQVTSYIACVMDMMNNGILLWDMPRTSAFGKTIRDEELLQKVEVGGAIFHLSQQDWSVTVKHVNEPMLGATALMASKTLYDINKKKLFGDEKL